MTLKEKFEEILIAFWTNEWESECEKVTDEFAIGFADWYLNLWHTDDDSSFDDNSPQELLEIYKKEKGL